MNIKPETETETTPVLVKADPTTRALFVDDEGAITIRAGTIFNGHTFADDTIVPHDAEFSVGSDYIVIVDNGVPEIRQCTGIPDGPRVLGGFHYAPGGCATARAGGSDIPTINSHSLWDRNFRPACPDPRGMALVTSPLGHRFWCDIYLLGVKHTTDGTSKLGVRIADGGDPPIDPVSSGASKRFEWAFKRFEYQHAVTVMAHHGKQLLSYDEFVAAMTGVTEKTACDDDPIVTKLDAPHTSRFGIMQATGNLWVWGHDGDPDEPRESLFGGSWHHNGHAGSRYGDVGRYWREESDEDIGARGRSDHLQVP